MSAPTPASARAPRGFDGTLAVGLVTFTLWSVLFRDLIVDDAFIYFRFAENIHGGHGWVWNLGHSPVEGVASLLWTVLLVPFANWQDGIYMAAKVLGLVFAVGTVTLARRTALVFAGPLAARVTTLLLLLSPLLVFHAMSGMDTSLSIFAVAALSLFSVHLAIGPPGEIRLGRAACFGAAWWLCSLVRPEIALFGALACGLLYIGFTPPDRRALARGVLVGALLPAVATLLVRYAYFGAFLPLPFYVKRAAPWPTAMGIGYVALSLAGLFSGGLLVMVFASRQWARSPLFGRDVWKVRPEWMVVVPALACLLTYAFSYPMMGYLYRFTIPFWVPIMIGAGAALARSHRRGDKPHWRPSLMMLVLYHALALVPALHQVRIVSPAANDVHLAFGRMLGRLPERGRLLALDDVGAAAYLSGWEADEGAGLVTADVSLRHASRADLIRTRKPDVIFLAECRTEWLGDALDDEYVLVAKIPWIVFTDGSLEAFQCVLCRASYPSRDLLVDRIRALGHAPRPAPWYFTPYRLLKHFLRL